MKPAEDYAREVIFTLNEAKARLPSLEAAFPDDPRVTAIKGHIEQAHAQLWHMANPPTCP